MDFGHLTEPNIIIYYIQNLLYPRFTVFPVNLNTFNHTYLYNLQCMYLCSCSKIIEHLDMFHKSKLTISFRLAAFPWAASFESLSV